MSYTYGYHRIEAPTIGVGITTLILASSLGIGAAHYAAVLNGDAMWHCIVAAAVTFGIFTGCAFSAYKDISRDR